MGLKLARSAVAGLAAGIVIGPAAPALAAPAVTVRVPCSSVTLAAAITAATSNETLRLAVSCRYVLTSAMPAIGENLTIAGNGATLERSTAAGTPPFAILTAAAGNLAVSRLSFRNGSGGAISYQSGSSAGGSIMVTGGTFTGNSGGAINDDGSPDGALTVTGARFTRNAGGAINDGDEDNDAGPLTVTRASFTGNTGGAITDFGNYNSGSDTVTGSTFTGNAGGAINYQSFPEGSPSTLVVTRSAFTRNTGSGITCSFYAYCDLSVTRSTFTGNAGGGISSGSQDIQMTVSRSMFTRNNAELGGAIDIDSSQSGTLTATSDTFTRNTATAGGGAIYNFDYVAATDSTFTGNSAPVGGGMENEWYSDVAGSTFRNNRAASAGGGLYNDDQISVTGSTFRKNTAASGGGIYQIPAGADNFGQSTPTITLTGSKIIGNKAAVNGGGIDNTIDTRYSGPGPGPGTVAVTSSRVVSNSADGDGGGIYNFGGGSVPLTSSVVTGNRPDNCGPAGAVPECLDGSATAAPAHELSPGRRFSPRLGVHCVVERLGRPSQPRGLRPWPCGVHALAAGEGGRVPASVADGIPGTRPPRLRPCKPAVNGEEPIVARLVMRTGCGSSGLRRGHR
ncbi:MAG: right-handed parallel beta-helix repeat-containing protein [Streptosporangiaceae bacterium]|jgi:hypothetical protein